MFLPADSPENAKAGRRKVIGQLGVTAVGSLCAPAWLSGQRGSSPSDTIPHPHLYWRSDNSGSLRTVDSVKKAVTRPGLSHKIWKKIEAACKAEIEKPPLTCRSLFPGRPESAAAQNNPDYTICREAGQRILRYAVALHLTGDEVYKTAAMEQLEALFDESVWPDWIDHAHIRFGFPADLRTGMLSQDTGLAYDWLYPFLNDKERAFIIEGIDRRGIRPYLRSMDENPWWAHDLNNWYTVIIGGLGIAGMALGDDHPEAEKLVEMSLPKMRRYLSIYGKDGSFNESVAYSNATRIPVAYFYAYYYHHSGEENPLSSHPFPQTAEWTIHATMPPGRWAALGDGWTDAPIMAAFMTAIAAATRDPVVQGYAKRHLGTSPNPYELLWFDAGLAGCSPEGKLSLGKAFQGNSALVFSRTSWDPEKPAMIVYGKAKRAGNHGHNDLGQLCIDARGKRMITDPGSPSSYPSDFFDEGRYRYYNASVHGHNVLMLGGREQRHPSGERGTKETSDLSSVNGSFLQSGFDEVKGGFWQLDLTRAYAGTKRVRRTVVHLFPGWVAVLDEAELIKSEDISLRWHTIQPAEPDKDGNFQVINEDIRLACRVEALAGQPVSLDLKQHDYQPPYHLDRLGEPLEQRHEPYVELILKDSACRILTLFALTEGNVQESTAWQHSGDKWSWGNKSASCEVTCTEKTLALRDLKSGKAIEVALQEPAPVK